MEKIKDKYGNILLKIKDIDKIVWYIKLRNGKTKKIGYQKENTFYTNRNENHIFRKLNAFGFNYNLVKQLLEENDEIKIIVKYNSNKYCINLDLEKFEIYKKNTLNFSKKGFEPQIFICLDDFKII